MIEATRTTEKKEKEKTDQEKILELQAQNAQILQTLVIGGLM